MEIIPEDSLFELTEKTTEPESPFAQAYLRSINDGGCGLFRDRHLVRACGGDRDLVYLTPLGEKSPIYMMEHDVFKRGGDKHVSLVPFKGEDVV